jgi:hypothetical protein
VEALRWELQCLAALELPYRCVFHDVFVLGKVHLAEAIINMGNDVMLKTIKSHKLNRMRVLYDRDNPVARDEKPVRDAYLLCADPI